MTLSKPFLILQLRPEDDTSDSEFNAILKYGGMDEKDVCRMRIENTGIPALSLNDYSAVIVGGSPLDISTPQDEKSDIQKKIETDFTRLLDEIVVDDFPFLGACSGCGLLGSYLNAPVSGKYSEPVGSTIISLTEEGKSDTLLSDFPDQITVLLGHKEACDTTPVGATLLMRGAACPVQMFRVGKNVYATQFHPEGDCEGFQTRIHAYKNHGYFRLDEVESLCKAVGQVDTPYAQKLLRRFVSRYAI